MAVASLEVLVEAAFMVLSDAVVQVTDKTVMFRPFLRRLKSTLDFLKPFIEDIAQHNKVLNRPKEELEKLRIQMVTGVELVGACSKVHQWTCSNEKYKYTDQLFKLDESLQWQLSIIIEQVARDMRETSSLIRNIQEVVKKIEGGSILQNQVELECFCDIAEPAIPIVELEAINVQGIRSETKETFSAVNMNEGVRGIEGGDKVLEVAESQPPTVVLNAQGTIEEEVKETLGSTRDVEEDYREIKGSDEVLQIVEPQPPTVVLNVQGTSEEEVKETLGSTRDVDKDIREIEGSDEVLGVTEPQPPTVVLNVQGTSEEEVKETLGSTRDVEKDIREIEGSDEVLGVSEPQPPTVVLNVQGTSEEEVKETLESIRDHMEEESEGIGGSAEVVQVAEPQPPTAELDVLNAKGTRDEMDRMDSAGDIEERIKLKRIARSEFKGSRMAADLAAGGAMGVPFTMLYETIKEVVIKTSMFRPLLEELKSQIEALNPLIAQMDSWVLDRPEKELREFKVQMEKGPKLITKCANLSKWKSYKKYKYSNQLLELQSSLQNLLFILQWQQVRDLKETLAATKNVETRMQRTDVNVAVLKEEGMTVMKETLDEVRNIGTVVRRIDKKGEVQSQIDCDVPEPPLVGLYVPLRELKMKLLKNDNVSMLVLTAPGGCGKTTLATKFCQDEEVKDIFKNNIFFITVTKKSTFNLIVQGLHQRKSTDVPMFQDEGTAVKWLRKFLMEGQNVLLVLDDVWFDSKYILEKFDEVKMPNFKILVTSRSQFPEYGSVYHLKSLNDRDAMTLFRRSASLGDGQWNNLAREIVAPCKGHPLAIKVVGKSLRGKPIEFWRKRALEWSKGDSIIDSETEVLLRLQTSLDALDEKEAFIKECFLDLGSFPQDQRIPAGALIDMWAELYEDLDKDFLAITNVYELTTRSLADLGVTRKETMEDDDYYSEHFVTQHDLLRQLAVYQAKLDPSKKRLIIGNRGDNLPKCLTEQKHQPIKPRLLSISSDETFSTNLHNIQLADVEVLVLNFNTKSYALPEFVEKMVNLKVLIVTNHGFIPAELSNFHLLDSLPNLKRIRLECISIPSITKHPIQLKSLKKISLFMCSIGEAFSNCSFQNSNALPNLEEMNIDYCNDLVELPAALCALVNLKKLSITNSHKLSALPEEIGKLVNLEVLRLRFCTDLAKLPDSTRNLEKLNFLDIADCYSIRELPQDFGGMSSLKKINMRMCSRLQELPSSVVDLEQLQEVVCDEDTGDLWALFLPHLKNLHIKPVKENVNLSWL